MPDNRLRARVGLASLGLVCVVAVGSVVGSQSAADDLRPKAERALSAAGITGVAVGFEGREARLSGGTSVDLARARAIVEGIHGVRWARVGDADIGISVATPVPTLDLRRTSDGLSISGTVPDADVAAELKSRAAEDFGVTVSGDLVVDPSVGRAGWAGELPGVFGDIVGVKDLVLRIDGGGNLELDGSIESMAGADKVHDLVEAAVPDLDVVSRIHADPRGLPAADAMVLNSTTVYFGRGKSSLGAASKAALDSVAEVLERNSWISIEAGGHAGPSDPIRAMDLSDARVAAVRDYLVRAGIEPNRIGTASYASDKMTTVDAFARTYRRVDFVVEEN
jgi:outer membrane protein OmpA-like peptidoglycan-associated protein